MLKACFQHGTPTLRADTNRTASALRAVGITWLGKGEPMVEYGASR
jgi:hypothetical protein